MNQATPITAAPAAAAVIGRCTVCPAVIRFEIPPEHANWASAEVATRAAGLFTYCPCRKGVTCPELPSGFPACNDPWCEGHDRTDMKFRWLKATWKAGVPCRGSCATAKTSICTCECAGRNHGIAWARS